MPLSKKDAKWLEQLDLLLLNKVGKLEEMVQKHRSRVERSRSKDKDFSLSITLDDVREALDEARAQIHEACEEYADR